MALTYRIIAGSAVERFHNSRVKIRMYGGGFGNGKTTAAVNETLRIVRDYPGMSTLIARSTFAKLEDSIGTEFFKWCPSNWIKQGTLRSGSVSLVNGSKVDFNHLSQNTSGVGEQSSNLLSANYGLIVVDQIEDPEITEKDFLDMLGRLRQATEKAEHGDATMPPTGPRMMILTFNPALGWVYNKLVKPYHDWKKGIYNENLLCELDADRNRILDEHGRPTPIIEVLEATTYDNAQNLAPDYIKTLEATYRGKMRDRYLLGKWVAFDGAVYEEYDENVHAVPDSMLRAHLSSLRLQGERLRVLEAYDLGITVPSCYLYAEVDSWGNVYITDGFYKKPFDLDEQVKAMIAVRGETDEEINADPQIFKKTSVNGHGIGQAPSDLFAERGIRMRRANNDRKTGILNVKQYLVLQKAKVNPFTGTLGAPKLYFSDKLSFLHDEFVTYRWKRGVNDDGVDQTVDVNDHAMDTLRYMLSGRVRAGVRHNRKTFKLPAGVLRWTQQDTVQHDARKHRYE